MNDSIGVPADSQGTTPITLALVIENLEHGLSALDKQHYDALTGNLAQEIENLDVLMGEQTNDPLWSLTMEHAVEALDLTITMIDAEFADSAIRFMISDVRRHLLAAGGAA